MPNTKKTRDREEGYSKSVQIGCLILIGVAICADAFSADYDVSPYLLVALFGIVIGVDKERIISIVEALFGKR